MSYLIDTSIILKIRIIDKRERELKYAFKDLFSFLTKKNGAVALTISKS